MIELLATPTNAEHFARLMSFAREVLVVCDQFGVTSVLDGSLAVLAYTGDPSMEIHDVDFSCPESQFPRLQQALESPGIACRVRPWHVLQARRGDLKIEFGATEHWNRGIPDRHETLKVGDVQFCLLGIDGLREQYRRGLVDTERQNDDSRNKYQAYRGKFRLLEAPKV